MPKPSDDKSMEVNIGGRSIDIDGATDLSESEREEARAQLERMQKEIAKWMGALN